MTAETAFDLLRRANPVPDPAAFRARLEAERGHDATTRRHVMDTITETARRTAPPPTPRMRRWVPAAAVAAAILIVTPLVLLRDGGPFGSSTPTPIEVAEAYIAARNAYDAEAMRDLVADSIRTPDDWAPGGFPELDLAMEARRLHEVQTRVIECDVVPNQPSQVICQVAVELELQRIVNHPPFEVEMWFLVSEEGKISSYVDGFPPTSFWDDVLFPFDAWLREADPQAQATLHNSPHPGPPLTPEAFEVTPRVLAEYRAFIESGG